MKKFLRGVVLFLFVPFTAGALYWEANQNFSGAGHRLAQAGIVILIFCLAWAWNDYDTLCTWREIVAQQSNAREVFQRSVSFSILLDSELDDPLIMTSSINQGSQSVEAAAPNHSDETMVYFDSVSQNHLPVGRY